MEDAGVKPGVRSCVLVGSFRRAGSLNRR